MKEVLAVRKEKRKMNDLISRQAAIAVMLIALFGAVLQQSYRMYPPTDEEIAENPALEVYRP